MPADDVKRKFFGVLMSFTSEKIDDGEYFNFTYIQRAGAGSRALCAPFVSSTFVWTGKQLSTLAKVGVSYYTT